MSLTGCIAKAGSLVSKEMKAEIVSAAKANRAAGMKPLPAAIAAIQADLDRVRELISARTQTQSVVVDADVQETIDRGMRIAEANLAAKEAQAEAEKRASGEINFKRDDGDTTGLPKKNPAAAAIAIRNGEKLGSKVGMSIHQVGAYFDKLMGGKRDFNDPVEQARAVKQLVAELKYQMQTENSGLDWYEEDVKKAFESTTRVIPGLKLEQKRQLFSVVAGIMSPSTNARDNWVIAAEAFDHFEKTGIIPERNPANGQMWRGGLVSATKTKQLRMLNSMVQDIGEVPATEWLMGMHTVKELNAARMRWGQMGPGVSGKADEQAMGMVAFGPKIGPFVMNINGIHEVTIDMWATRTFNRYFGAMLDENGVIIDAPTEPQRVVAKEIFNAAAAKLGIKGYQAQSSIWFFEQQLFNQLGTGAESYGFSDGGRKFAESNGYGDAGDVGGAQANVGGAQGPARAGVAGPSFSRGAGGAGLSQAVDSRTQPSVRGPSLKGLAAEVAVNGQLTRFGGFLPAQQAARNYMAKAGLKYTPVTDYVKVDTARAKRVADAFEGMAHDPQDAEVKASYAAMIAETIAQWKAIKATGLQVEFIDFDKTGDPYGNPRNAILDVVQNNHLWVFPTSQGFGGSESADVDTSGNPLEAVVPGEMISGRAVQANDIFRVVHDYFGHIKEGVGFRADGEENAWRAHASMYTPLARRAMTTETRGQNSWVNYGPHSEFNKTANGGDTQYAPQKVGLLPAWVSEEGATDEKQPADTGRDAAPAVDGGRNGGSTQEARPGQTSVAGIHYSSAAREALDGRKYGTGLKGAERNRIDQSQDARLKDRVYFYVDEGSGIRPESGVGGIKHEVKSDNLYDINSDPLGLRQADSSLMESAILDAGFDGYFIRKVFNDQGVAVIIGEASHAVPSKATNPPAKVEAFKQVRFPYVAPVKQASFARDSLKMESVTDAIDFTSSKDLKMDLGVAIQHRAWADAFMLAKDPAQRKKLLSQMGDATIEAFADSKIKVSRWIQGLPLADTLTQRLEGDLRRSDTIRSALEGDVTDQFTTPMMAAITKAAKASKLSSDQVKKMAGYWMAGRYAPEASAHLIQKDRTELLAAQAKGDPALIAAAQAALNERILDVNGGIGQAKTRGVGGGMNNAEAAQIVANVEGHIDPALLDEIAAPVYAMLAWKKAQDIASGKVTQTMVNSWRNSPLYVPLTGDPRADRESTDVFSSGGQVNQEVDKEMNGRKDSVADDGIDAAFTAVIKSVNFSAMQDFKRSLNKAYEAAQLAGVDIGLTREAVTGIMRTGDDVIIHRDTARRANGTEFTSAQAFKFKDERIMEALKKDNQEQLNAFWKVIATPTRWYSRAVTQFMPMFAPINLVRDIWERSELLRTRKLYDTSGNEIDVGKAARQSLVETISRDVWKASMMKAFKMGGMTPVRGDLEEMIRLGGSSTTGDYLSRTAGDLEAEIRGDASKLGHATNKVLHKVESYNDMFEMIPSLSIYRSLKAQGMAPKDAAAAVLDLMNFRKKGTKMPAVRALYTFAQPAATSGYNLAQYLSTRTGQVRFATMTLIGGALYGLLRAAWGDDEDEELGNKLDNLSNFTVERSIPIKLGDHVLKIPIGFGAPQLSWLTAVTMSRWASGRYNGADAGGELAKGWAKNFMAVAPSEMELSKHPANFVIQTFTPTILKPLFNVYADQTNFGAPLTPSFKNPDKLKSEQARRTTAEAYSDVAKTVYEITGVDIYPDHIKAIADGVLIGPMRELMNLTVEAAAKEARGEPMRVPLVASLIDSLNDRQALNQVYGRVRDDMDSLHRKFSSLQANRDPDGEITPEMKAAERSYQRFMAAEKMIGIQRAALKKMTGLDEETRNARTQSIEERADAAHRKLLVGFFSAE